LAGFELQEAPPRPGDSPAGPIPPDRSWSPLECWIWEKLQTGAIANIDEYGDGSGRLPPAYPTKPAHWHDGRRRLAPSFLEDLLLREPYRSGLHRKGVRVEAAWFAEEIDLSMAELDRPLWLDRCRFKESADLKYLRTSSPISLDGSCFAAQLNLQGAWINANLFMSNGTDIGLDLYLRSASEQQAEFNTTILNGAKVGGQVDMTGAKVTGTLALDSIEIGRSLLMASNLKVSRWQAEFNHVVLRGASVGGQVALIGAKIAGTLAMDSIEIGRSLLMASDHEVSETQAEFNTVVLNGAKVGGQVVLNGAKVARVLEMDSAHIGQSLYMTSDRRGSEHQAEFSHVVLRGAKVGGQVVLTGAKITATLNLDSADIGQSPLMSSDQNASEQRTELNDVVLRSAKISGQVTLTGTNVAGILNMSATEIGQSVLMASDPKLWEQRTQLDDVVLRSAKVGGSLDLSGAEIAGTLDMDSADIGQHLFMRGNRPASKQLAEFADIRLIFAVVGGSLDVRGAALSNLDLTGTQIGGELRLASPSWTPQWRDCGKLVLWNTSLDAIQDTGEGDAWPPVLDLGGLTYDGSAALGRTHS
jgi:uncharacterized protein YjbI with pentapeptide repeats